MTRFDSEPGRLRTKNLLSYGVLVNTLNAYYQYSVFQTEIPSQSLSKREITKLVSSAISDGIDVLNLIESINQENIGTCLVDSTETELLIRALQDV